MTCPTKRPAAQSRMVIASLVARTRSAGHSLGVAHAHTKTSAVHETKHTQNATPRPRACSIAQADKNARRHAQAAAPQCWYTTRKHGPYLPVPILTARARGLPRRRLCAASTQGANRRPCRSAARCAPDRTLVCMACSCWRRMPHWRSQHHSQCRMLRCSQRRTSRAASMRRCHSNGNAIIRISQVYFVFEFVFRDTFRTLKADQRVVIAHTHRAFQALVQR
jgi:hypothetical protein